MPKEINPIDAKKLGFLKKLLILAAIVISGLYLSFQMVDSNQSDESIVLQSITGKMTVVTEPGPYFRFFGNIHKYKKVIAVNFTGNREADAVSKLEKIRVRFLDTSMGEAIGVARFRLPTTPEQLIKIHREFGSQNALVSNMLERQVIEAVKASARTMSVEEHYTGGAGQLSLDFDDQLRNGIFIIDQHLDLQEVLKEETDEVVDKEELPKTAQRILQVRKRMNEEGNIMRTNNPLADYGISVISASIEDVDYEARVDERLAAQKKAAADEALARQNLKKAQQEAKTARALGEKAIAETRASSEEQKLKAEIEAEKIASVALINAQRELDVAKQRTLQQKAQLELQRLEAEGLSVLAEARKKAAEFSLDPKVVFESKIAAWKEVEIAKYQYMSRAQLVPNVMMGGDNGQKQDTALTMLEMMGVKAALDLGMQFEKIGKVEN